jgi:hypothetical protein
LASVGRCGGTHSLCAGSASYPLAGGHLRLLVSAGLVVSVLAVLGGAAAKSGAEWGLGVNQGGHAFARPPDAAKHSRKRNFARCIPQRYGEPGRITASAPPKWNCRRLRTLYHHAGDPAFTFKLFGHRWQCLVIARPDHKRHTTLGCFHVRWKFDPEYKRPPGKPIVRFFLPFTAS